MIDRHSLGHSVQTEHSPRIAQISNIADLLASFLSDEDQTAGCSGIAGSNQFELIIGFAENLGDDCFYVIFISAEFLLENLCIFLGTLGMTVAQY